MSNLPLLGLIPATISIVFAAGLVVKQIDGWGWFLFIGLLLGLAAVNGGVR